MEPKKIKKLSLNKETIANLTNDEMVHHKGGSIFYTICMIWTCEKPCSAIFGGCGGNGGGLSDDCISMHVECGGGTYAGWSCDGDMCSK